MIEFIQMQNEVDKMDAMQKKIIPNQEDRQELVISRAFNAPHDQVLAAWDEPDFKLPQKSDVTLTFAEHGLATRLELRYEDVSMLSDEERQNLKRAWETCLDRLGHQLEQGDIGRTVRGGTGADHIAKMPCDDIDDTGRLPRCEL